MRKQRIEYSSPLDALIAVSKRLNAYELQHSMCSEDFFDRYNRGQLGDDAIFIDWANDYRHYMAVRRTLEQRLQYAA